MTEPKLTGAVEIVPGHHYLLHTDSTVTDEQAGSWVGILRDRFPGSTFAVAVGAVRIEDAADTLETRLYTVLSDTAVKLYGYAAKAEPGPSRAAWSVVAGALLDVATGLTESGDGAATPPADPPPTGVATPGEQAAPSSRTATVTVRLDTEAVAQRVIELIRQEFKQRGRSGL